jgi:Fructose-2,6-bisphosphatase
MRHGQTAANEANIFCGRLDPPLSPQGEAEARFTAQALGADFNRVLVSAALRAQQTARIVCPDMRPETLPALREIGFGDFDGLTAAQIESRMPQSWARYIADPLRFAFPGGDDAEQYLREAEKTALALTRGEGRTLAVSHKGFITAALSALLHGDASHMLRYDIRPAGFARLKVSGGSAVLAQLF